MNALRAILVTYEPLDDFSNYQPLSDAIDKFQNVRITRWAWVVALDATTPEELAKILKPICGNNCRLFIAEYIKPQRINLLGDGWEFASNN